MGKRTTKADLEKMVAHINHMTVHAVRTGYVLDRDATGVRLAVNNGSTWVSPRMTAGALMEWMRAYSAGILDGVVAECDRRDVAAVRAMAQTG